MTGLTGATFDACPHCHQRATVLGHALRAAKVMYHVRCCSSCGTTWHTSDDGSGERLESVQTRTPPPRLPPPARKAGNGGSGTWASAGSLGAAAAGGSAGTTLTLPPGTYHGGITISGVHISGGVTISGAHVSAGGSSVCDPPLLEAEEPPEPCPAMLGSVIGYRAWATCPRTLSLVGTGGVSMEPWVPGVNEAKCASVYSHPAPASNHTCGLYALARFDHQNPWWSDCHILGAVEAWADVDEDGNADRFFLHSDPGFRAQYAKIVLLATSDAFPRVKNDFIRKVLAPLYGVDVCKREHLEDAAKEHGQLVPDELIEWVRSEKKRGANRALALSANENGEEDGEALLHPAGFLVPKTFAEKRRFRPWG